MNHEAELQKKLCSADVAAAQVESGHWIDVGGALVQPDLFDQALGRRKDDLRDVRVRYCLSMSPRAIFETDPEGEHFHAFNWHFSAYDRAKNIDGRINYIPMNFGEAPDYYRRFVDPIDVVCIKTRPMDGQGFFNFGGATTYLKAASEQARILIVETCEQLPYIYGEQESLHISQVDYVIDGGKGTAAEIQNPEISDVDRKVAEFVLAEIGIAFSPGSVLSASGEVHRSSGLRQFSRNSDCDRLHVSLRD